MTLKSRLDRIAKDSDIDNDSVETKLPDPVKQLLMQHHLLMHGVEGAADHAADLHTRSERRPRTITPMPNDVRETLRQHADEIRLEHGALPADERAALERSGLKLEMQARTFLAEARHAG